MLKALTQDVFFHFAITTHFIGWVEAHRNINKFFI
ncbi:Uncharacterised protein [Vibrio cholerae]|nr:Uncharacterised protein [Vibrio cholerae]